MAHPTEAQVGDGRKDISPFPSSASISVYLRFKSAIDPFVKKSDRPFPHPRPSACICGSKVRSTGASKRELALSPIRVHPRISAVQKCDRPVRQKERSTLPPSASISVYQRFKSAINRCVKKSDRTFYKYQQAPCFQRNITPCNNDIYP